MRVRGWKSVVSRTPRSYSKRVGGFYLMEHPGVAHFVEQAIVCDLRHWRILFLGVVHIFVGCGQLWPPKKGSDPASYNSGQDAHYVHSIRTTLGGHT